MSRFTLALRLLFRDGRSGELTILVAALVIAVTCSTAITLFADRLQKTMVLQSADFLAADLVIATPTPIDENWRNQAGSFGLNSSSTVEFSSVLIENDEMLLAGVKAVSSTYPLRGFLRNTQADLTQEETVTKGPEPGQVWVEKRILAALKINVGDPLTVGEKQLTVTRIITHEPDKRGDFYSLSPRVMMAEDDLAATQVIQPGSHIHYFFQFSGDVRAISQFKAAIKPQLNPSQRIMDIHEDRPELGDALKRAERYLGLSSIVVVLIAGVAIAISTRRYSERHFDTTALLRCLGCKQNEVLYLYGVQFLILGLLASSIGCLLGFIAQYGLFYLLKDLIPNEIAAPGLFSVILGLSTGMAILLGFAFPPLLRLKQVSPLRVLRRDLAPLPNSAWLIYGMALLLVAVLIWRYTEDLRMTSTILGAGVVLTLLLSLLIHALLVICQKQLPRLSSVWRFGVQGLVRNRQTSVSQILAFSITLMAMVLSFSVRNDLLSDWQKQLPENAPNHFVLNIFPDQEASFKQELADQKISGSQFFPVVRGRLVAINETPVQKIVSKESQGERAIHRDLSLTWSANLPEENKITEGQWWTDNQTGLVSVERKLAESLGVKLGDELTFTVGSEQLKATIASIRDLRWDTMRPNFYMVFSPGTLDSFASTLITSFYIPQTQKNWLNTLAKTYPSITILEVDAILKQFNRLLAQLTQAINYLLYFALMAGFTVLFAAVYTSIDLRVHESAIMRTLGAHRSFLRKTHMIEFSLLGLSSGLLAAMLSETLLYLLYTFVLNLDYQPNFYLWLVLPAISSLFIGLTGYWSLKDVVNKAPLAVLSEL
jgi:putative ABC transport system permease protein